MGAVVIWQKKKSVCKVSVKAIGSDADFRFKTATSGSGLINSQLEIVAIFLR